MTPATTRTTTAPAMVDRSVAVSPNSIEETRRETAVALARFDLAIPKLDPQFGFSESDNSFAAASSASSGILCFAE